MRAVHLSLPYTERTDNSTFDYTAKRKNTSIISCNSLSTFANASGASRRFVLADRILSGRPLAVASCLLRGCGDLTRAARKVRNDSGGIRAKKRLSGALLSSENWLMQGEMAVPCCVLKRRLARGAALPCCVLKRSTGAIVRPRTCAKNRVAPGN